MGVVINRLSISDWLIGSSLPHPELRLIFPSTCWTFHWSYLSQDSISKVILKFSPIFLCLLSSLLLAGIMRMTS